MPFSIIVTILLLRARLHSAVSVIIWSAATQPIKMIHSLGKGLGRFKDASGSGRLNQ
ncbi:hypothetical protein SCLCIDRAFT_1219070 [Scleroderma citrinum Foug A]|uniref:Uncharacterized protein n=1 Tax=Scleroderma citrinum Foug A TaxID=1036808 RepID=A0A0C2ZZF1_9AGAM|nr:hypothetical protein SCLCIDRAFT_1219070 [Scleroderma citrinum Foug A]